MHDIGLSVSVTTVASYWRPPQINWSYLLIRHITCLWCSHRRSDMQPSVDAFTPQRAAETPLRNKAKLETRHQLLRMNALRPKSELIKIM